MTKFNRFHDLDTEITQLEFDIKALMIIEEEAVFQVV
jgi:hypothetical protein